LRGDLEGLDEGDAGDHEEEQARQDDATQRCERVVDEAAAW
jgi:hypothetical protein